MTILPFWWTGIYSVGFGCRNKTTQARSGSTSCWVKGVESGTGTVLDMGSCEGTLVTPSFNGHDQLILVSTHNSSEILQKRGHK